MKARSSAVIGKIMLADTMWKTKDGFFMSEMSFPQRIKAPQGMFWVKGPFFPASGTHTCTLHPTHCSTRVLMYAMRGACRRCAGKSKNSQRKTTTRSSWGSGASTHSVNEKRLISKDELDQACPDRAIEAALKDCPRQDHRHGIIHACLHTYNAAWTTFDEKERGSLETGKIADMAVLNRNPLAMKPKELLGLKVETLPLKGEPYRKGQRILNLLAKGLRMGVKM